MSDSIRTGVLTAAAAALEGGPRTCPSTQVIVYYKQLLYSFLPSPPLDREAVQHWKRTANTVDPGHLQGALLCV